MSILYCIFLILYHIIWHFIILHYIILYRYVVLILNRQKKPSTSSAKDFHRNFGRAVVMIFKRQTLAFRGPAQPLERVLLLEVFIKRSEAWPFFGEKRWHGGSRRKNTKAPEALWRKPAGSFFCWGMGRLVETCWMILWWIVAAWCELNQMWIAKQV